MIISLIWAEDLNGVIGKDNTLPWHSPNDFKHFKETTQYKTVIMGRKTWESLPIQPLPNRLNIIVSKHPKEDSDRVLWASSLSDAVQRAEKLGFNEIFIIGGRQLYEQSIPFADRLYQTIINTIVADGDTYFPEWDEDKFQLSEHKKQQGDLNQVGIDIRIWEKKRKHRITT